jgi:hypothetical protein
MTCHFGIGSEIPFLEHYALGYMKQASSDFGVREWVTITI